MPRVSGVSSATVAGQDEPGERRAIRMAKTKKGKKKGKK
jgi:hypothetical protein